MRMYATIQDRTFQPIRSHLSTCEAKQAEKADAIPSLDSEIIVPFAHPIYARSILDYLNSRGISPSTVLSQVGLAWQDLCDGRFMDYAMFRRFVAQAIRRSGEPALGLLAGSMFQPYHSAVGIAAVTSQNLDQGLQFLSRHARLLFGSVDFRLKSCARWATLEVRPTHPLHETHNFIVQFIVGAYGRLLEAMLGRPVDELRVGLPYARPAGNDVPCTRFVRHLEFDHECLTFRIPSTLLQAPCASADAREFEEAAQICQRMEAEQGHSAFTRRVRHALLERLSTDPGSRALASNLGISAQTMARRLADAGIKYSDLKNDLRKSQATWYLRHTDMPIEAIASQLGYTDSTNFSRAFRRWHGVTPRTMRQQLRGSPEAVA